MQLDDKNSIETPLTGWTTPPDISVLSFDILIVIVFRILYDCLDQNYDAWQTIPSYRSLHSCFHGPYVSAFCGSDMGAFGVSLGLISGFYSHAGALRHYTLLLSNAYQRQLVILFVDQEISLNHVSNTPIEARLYGV